MVYTTYCHSTLGFTSLHSLSLTAALDHGQVLLTHTPLAHQFVYIHTAHLQFIILWVDDSVNSAHTPVCCDTLLLPRVDSYRLIGLVNIPHAARFHPPHPPHLTENATFVCIYVVFSTTFFFFFRTHTARTLPYAWLLTAVVNTAPAAPHTLPHTAAHLHCTAHSCTWLTCYSSSFTVLLPVLLFSSRSGHASLTFAPHTVARRHVF